MIEISLTYCVEIKEYSVNQMKQKYKNILRYQRTSFEENIRDVKNRRRFIKTLPKINRFPKSIKEGNFLGVGTNN